jgi:outer membrane protein assembly factor BamB
MAMRRLLSGGVLVLWVAMSPCVGAASVEERLAERVLKASGRTRGLCIDLASGSGALAVEIAKQSKLFVQAAETDDARVAAARKTLEASGLYGPRVAAERVDLSRLPYPDYCANLVVRGDFFATKRPGFSWKEVVRVLQPGGLAVLGAPAGSTPKLDVTALRRELAAAGIRDAKIDTTDGLWVTFRRPRPAGMGDWSHRSGGPGGGNSVEDDLVRAPFHTSWIAPPTNFTKFGLVVASEGRFIMRHGGITHTGRWTPSKNPDTIAAYDGYNGAFLWSAKLPEKDGNGLVAVGGAVYAAAGWKLVALDAATGAERWTREPGDVVKEMVDWSYYAADAGMLIVGLRQGRRQQKGTPPTKVLAGLDPATGKVKWTAPDLPGFGGVTLGGGKVIYVSRSGFIAALDIRTGTQAWRTPHRFMGGPRYHRGRVYVKNAAFDAKTGKLVRKGGAGLLAGQYSVGGGIGGVNVVELATGKRARIVAPFDPYSPKTGIPRGGLYARCITRTASTHCYFFSYSGTVIADLDRKVLFPAEAARGNCRTGVIAGNGLVYNSASGCRCTFAIRGNAALVPVAPALYDATPASKPPARLEKGAAFASPLGAADDPKQEWPAYRHDATRNCVTTATVAPPLTQAWAATLEGWLTPPSAGAGRVFVGSSNHSVYGLDATTGEVRWRYRTGGRVNITPTYWRGRVYAGNQDGWVYCLRASDGALVWRFRGAPHERKLLFFGRPQSVWPIGGGVIVEKNVAIFCAGRSAHDRVFVTAVDATTGKVLWQNNDLGRAVDVTGPAAGISPHGVSPSGIIAADDDVVMIPNGTTFPAGLRRSDGKILYWNKRGDSTERSNINIQHLGGSNLSIGGGWAFVGGPYEEYGGGRRRLDQKFFAVKPKTGRVLGQDDPKHFGKVGRDPATGKTILPQNYKWGVRTASFGNGSAPIVIDDDILIFRIYPGCYRIKDWLAGKRKKRWSLPGGAVAVAGDKVVGASGNTFTVIARTNGRRLWQGKASVKGAVRENGLAVAAGKVFATTGNSEVLCLNSK